MSKGFNSNKKPLSTGFKKVGTAQRTPRGKTTRPNINKSDITSPNWSGYAREAQPGTFEEVAGAFIVPAIPTRPADYNATVSVWMGIDGLREESHIIQTGILAGYMNNTPYYLAFYEVYPALPVYLTPSVYPVIPGDTMTVEISKEETSWRVQLNNLTRNWNYSQLVNYNGAQQSVEFIVERAYDLTRKQYDPLANFGQVTFDVCFINYVSANFNISERVVMMSSRRTLATPSAPDDDNDGFRVSYGSRIPSPPPSSGKRMVNICKKGSMFSTRIGNSTLSVPSILMKPNGNRMKRK